MSRCYQLTLALSEYTLRCARYRASQPRDYPRRAIFIYRIGLPKEAVEKEFPTKSYIFSLLKDVLVWQSRCEYLVEVP